MDVLSDVLETVKLKSQVLGRLDLGTPFGVCLDRRAYSVFHLILEGDAWFQVEREKPMRVTAGDVLLLPRGSAHTVRDAPDSKVAPFDYTAPPAKHPAFSGVCGTFRFEDRHTESLFASLPKVLHVRELDDEIGPWLEQTMQLIAYESKRRRPGSTTAASGLCDTLFVYLLRSHLARRPSGWLKALADPQVGRALELIHAEPKAPWTVPQLAARVGMSRSVFAARFSSVVGRSPLQYVVDWRLQKAASLLRESRRSLAEIASDVGYESEAAFNKAFKRSMGTTPGAFRTRETANATMNGAEARANN